MKMRRVWNMKILLALASFIGFLNICYLHLFVTLSTNSGTETFDQLQENLRVLRRQIASVDPGYETEQRVNVASYNYLELLNLDIKDAFERYEISKTTIAKQYMDALAENFRESFNHTAYEQKEKVDIEPRCVKTPFLLIEVHSHPENFMSREAIRLTWGRQENAINQGTWSSPESTWKTVFLVGHHENPAINNLLKQEASVYGDIVLGDFQDTFRNLSQKMLLGIRWPLDHCKALYILKTDEDCYVNVLALLEWLASYDLVNGSTPLYAGNVQHKTNVIRDKSDRYFVPKNLYPYRKYPDYVSGGGYVFSGSLLKKLAQVSRKMPVIPNEDACLGTFMHKLQVKPTQESRFLPFIFCDIDAPEGELFERPLCHFLRPLVVHGVTGVSHIHIHYNVMLMTFAPTLCLYIERQPYGKQFPRRC